MRISAQQNAEDDNSYIAEGLVLESHRQAEELLEKLRAVIGQESTFAGMGEVLPKPALAGQDDDSYTVEDILSIISSAGSAAEVEDILQNLFTSIEASMLRDKAKAKKHEEFLQEYLFVIESRLRQQGNVQVLNEQMLSPQKLVTRENQPQQLQEVLRRQLVNGLKVEFEAIRQAHRQVLENMSVPQVQLAAIKISNEIARQAVQVRDMAQEIARVKPENIMPQAKQVEAMQKENIAVTEKLAADVLKSASKLEQAPVIKDVMAQQAQLIENLVAVKREAIVQTRQAVNEYVTAAKVNIVENKTALSQSVVAKTEPVKDSVSIPKEELQKLVIKANPEMLVKPVQPVLTPKQPMESLNIPRQLEEIKPVIKTYQAAQPPTKPREQHICGRGCPEHGSEPPSAAHNHDCAKVHGGANIEEMAKNASRIETIKASGARWNAPPNKSPQTDSASLLKMADLILAA